MIFLAIAEDGAALKHQPKCDAIDGRKEKKEKEK